MTEWQPIETAPKDGTLVILYTQNFGVSLGSFGVDEGFSGDHEPQWFDDSYDDFSTGYSAVPLKPTHWMPLPKPPSE